MQMMMSDIRQTWTCYPTKVAGNAGRWERSKDGAKWADSGSRGRLVGKDIR